ncbi:hypothetical protein [Robertmurraya siralis]|uniref:hypothetical protein n=1 Tax=Robertmurraya siralis TaxID=77777 RepID=UPI001B87891C|nr:hypothetical protein [Robertmurraya siralis]
MYRLCWIPTGWNTPEMYRGVPHAANFKTLEDLKRVMRNCIYNGERIEDKNGNKIDIDLIEICVSL